MTIKKDKNFNKEYEMEKKMGNQIIEFDEDGDVRLNKIEELLLEGAIYDPIGFRWWHKGFKSYVEEKLIEAVEKNNIKKG